VKYDPYVWGISTLFLEACKWNFTEVIVRNYLIEIGLKVELVDVISTIFSENASNIVNHLKLTGKLSLLYAHTNKNLNNMYVYIFNRFHLNDNRLGTAYTKSFL
jgi:hypothetical protein